MDYLGNDKSKNYVFLIGTKIELVGINRKSNA